MKAYRKFIAFAAISSAASVASAQSAEVPTGGSPGWASYSNERHLVARLMGGAGLRLNDAYGAGINTPPFVLADVHFLFVNAGNFHMGPSLGVHVGFNGSHAAGVQAAVVPGWTVMTRLSRAFGVYGRLGIPILFTNGVTEGVAVPDSDVMGHSPALAPQNSTIAVGFGPELGIGASWYFLSGIALTAEINGGIYFGDSFYTFPYVGGGLGLMVDYELLP